MGACMGRRYDFVSLMRVPKRVCVARAWRSGVLDVGGGHGEVAFQLVNLNRVVATVVDPRPLRLRRFARKAGEERWRSRRLKLGFPALRRLLALVTLRSLSFCISLLFSFCFLLDLLGS